MRALLLLSLLLAPAAPAQDAGVGGDASPLVVLGSKWSRNRKPADRQEPAAPGTTPAAVITRADRNYERWRRANDPAGVRYPDLDTVDARSAAIEKNVRDARTRERKAAEGFEYRARVRNAGAKTVEIVFWEYQFTEAANPANEARRQFICGVQIKPGKEKELQAFSPAGPSAVIDVESLTHKSGELFAEKVTINRVEYADGTIWQRRDWNFGEVRASLARAVSTPWGPEMCRGL